MTNINSADQTDKIKRENAGKFKLCKKKKVLEAISVLKQLNKSYFETEGKKKPLLEESSESPIFLQVVLKKIPAKKAMKRIKVLLPHPLLTETTDVCLLTGDLDKTNRKAEIEPDVEYYKELLKKKDISKVTEVIPLRQLRTEYQVYETKRQLMAAYDVFLCDKKIAGCLPRLLGGIFIKKRKFPIQIDMERPNLKGQIERALSSTVFNLTCRGDSCTTEVARLGMETQEIFDNIMTSLKVLAENLPGQEKNISGLHIKTAISKGIPIYISFDDPSEVKLQKLYEEKDVEAEELSTLPNKKVKVFPGGYIKVENLPPSDDDDEENDKNSDELEQKKMSKKRKMETEISESENNGDIKPYSKSKKQKISKKSNQQDDTDENEIDEETSEGDEVVDIEEESSIENIKVKKRLNKISFKAASETELEGKDKVNVEKEKKEWGRKRKLENEEDEQEFNTVETVMKKKTKNKKNVEIDGDHDESIILSKFLLGNESDHEINLTETSLKKKRTKNKKNVKADESHNESMHASKVILGNENIEKETSVIKSTLKKKTKDKKNVINDGDHVESFISKILLGNESDHEINLAETSLKKKRAKNKKSVKAYAGHNESADASKIKLENDNNDEEINVIETTFKKKIKNKKNVKTDGDHDGSTISLNVLFGNENNLAETSLRKKTKNKKISKTASELSESTDVSKFMSENEKDDYELNVIESSLKRKSKNKTFKSSIHDESIGALEIKKANRKPNVRKSWVK